MKWNPTNYVENAQFVSELGMPVIELLAPQAGERILDLGCGDGALTKKLAAFDCAVVGIDSSPEMITAARSLGLDASVMDGSSLGFDGEFDAVFSNAAIHWMPDIESVVAGVSRALRPAGRFVGEFGGYGNVSVIVSAIGSALADRGLAAANPWRFPSAQEYGDILRRAGFAVESLELFPRPTVLPGDVGGWLRTFAQPFIAALAVSDRDDFISEVVEDLRAILVNENGAWIADYVRLRFAAAKQDRPSKLSMRGENCA